MREIRPLPGRSHGSRGMVTYIDPRTSTAPASATTPSRRADAGGTGESSRSTTRRRHQELTRLREREHAQAGVVRSLPEPHTRLPHPSLKCQTMLNNCLEMTDCHMAYTPTEPNTSKTLELSYIEAKATTDRPGWTKACIKE